MVAERKIPNFATKLIIWIMTDYEYIMAQCRKYHFQDWDDQELWKCLDMLPSIPREQLISLYRSKWVTSEVVKNGKVLKDCYEKVYIWVDCVGGDGITCIEFAR